VDDQPGWGDVDEFMVASDVVERADRFPLGWVIIVPDDAAAGGHDLEGPTRVVHHRFVGVCGIHQNEISAALIGHEIELA